MNFAKILSNTCWTPRSILLVAFLGCILFASAAEAASSQSSLAANWQTVKGSLPHPKIPSDPNKIQNTGSWAMDYAVGLGKIVGLGFAIAFLSILAGLVYGILKIIRAFCRKICCSKGDDEQSESEEEVQYTSWKRIWTPTTIYAICWILVLTGMCIGLSSNPKFSQGVDDMGDAVISVGTNAIELGNGLLSSVESIVALIPYTIDGIKTQFSGVTPLSDQVELLSVNVNSTSAQVSNITTSISQIDAGNTSAVSQLYAQLSGINNQSVSIISSVSSLTNQVAVQLKSTLNNTIGTLDEKVGEIDETVDGLESTAEGIIKQASDLVHNVIQFVNTGKSYDQSRQKALMGLFVLVIFGTLAIVIGYFVKIKAVFNIVAACSFVFLFFLWFSGSIHFMIGMVLYDVCPVIDITVQGMLPKDSQPAAVLKGCLYEHRPVLESMNITAYNLTEVFDYKDQFAGFANFSNNFNFSAIDSYFDSISSLYSYNLTQVADNMTVANYGWNETYVYTALDALNNQTYPDYFTLNNYTSCYPSNYSAPKNQSVYQALTALTNLVELNATIYNKTNTAKRQLYQAQADINNLLITMNALQDRFAGIKGNVTVLSTTNITNCIGILDNLQSNITGFFHLGNCSFLGDSYVEVRDGLCETMQPAIDCLTVGQFLAGLALIPMLIIAELLSFRYPKSIFVNPFSGGSDDYDAESGKGKNAKNEYEMAATKSPGPAPRRAITATIATGPPTESADSSPSSTPDFNAHRRIIMDPLSDPDGVQNHEYH